MRLLVKVCARASTVSKQQVALEKDIQFSSDENRNYAQAINSLAHATNAWTPALGKAIKSLWADPAIKTVFTKAASFDLQLNDTAEYFFTNIDRFLVDNYLPTDADILRTRIRSTGIEEATFVFDKMVFRVVDVGGQRSERKKWIHCFDCVKCILFCAALVRREFTKEVIF